MCIHPAAEKAGGELKPPRISAEDNLRLHPGFGSRPPRALAESWLLDGVEILDEVDVRLLAPPQVVGAAVGQIVFQARGVDVIDRAKAWKRPAGGVEALVKTGARPAIRVAREMLLSREFGPGEPGKSSEALLDVASRPSGLTKITIPCGYKWEKGALLPPANRSGSDPPRLGAAVISLQRHGPCAHGRRLLPAPETILKTVCHHLVLRRDHSYGPSAYAPNGDPRPRERRVEPEAQEVTSRAPPGPVVRGPSRADRLR